MEGVVNPRAAFLASHPRRSSEFGPVKHLLPVVPLFIPVELAVGATAVG